MAAMSYRELSWNVSTFGQRLACRCQSWFGQGKSYIPRIDELKERLSIISEGQLMPGYSVSDYGECRYERIRVRA